MDLLLLWPGGDLWAIEIKRSLTPKLERGFHEACTDLKPARKILIYPGPDSYPMGSDVQAMPLGQLCAELQTSITPGILASTVDTMRT